MVCVTQKMLLMIEVLSQIGSYYKIQNSILLPRVDVKFYINFPLTKSLLINFNVDNNHS